MMPTDQSTAASKNREIRVFLSSTFRDMEAERNHLIKHVFPKVRVACLARQVGFTEIDLRWGVTEEESRNGVTVDICLKEIDRCRDFPPFFFGFLGERYGWIPSHDDLAAFWEKHPDSPYAQAIQHAVSRGISVTELEMELAVLAEGAAAKLHGQALFLLRAPTFTEILYRQATGKDPDPNDTAYYDPADGRLDTLKDRIRATPFLAIDGYTRIEDFGQAIEDYLFGQLDRLYPADATPTPHERTQAAHGTFRYHRLNNFLPRDDVRGQLLAAINRRIVQPSLGPILLAGPSGQGKSALMADLARHLESTSTIDPIRWIVIDHYIGADEHNNLSAWIERLLNILHPEVADLVGDIPENPDEQRDALSTWLAYAARRTEQKETPAGQNPRPVRFVLLLDALDQLSDGGKNLYLLKPEILGPDAILVASAADGTPARESAGTYEAIIVPPLTVELTTRMIQDSLARYRKSLAPELAGRLAAAPQSGSPLFLTLALEELRLDARHESLALLLDTILACRDAKNLFLERYLRDEDYSRSQQPDLACRFMALIGAARAGLTELELADLLALPSDPVAADTGQPRLPQISLSLLMTSFQPYLLDKGGRRAPMHRILAEAGLEALGETVIREQLYGYFSPGYGKDGTNFQPRAAAEALYQITRRAQAEETQRARLEDDLANLPVPATLHDVAEEVVIEALSEFTYGEKSELAARWRAQVTPLAERDIEGIGVAIGDYSMWLSEKIGHYPAAHSVDVPLLEVRHNILGSEHPHTLFAMGNLANTLRDLGDLPGARTLEEQTMEARRRILGADHPDTLLAMNNLACTLSVQGDLPGAQALQEQVLEASRRVLGAEHSDTLRAMNNLANTLLDLGDLSEARAWQEQVLEVSQRLLGAENPHTLIAMGNLAHTLFEQGDLQGALALEEQVLESRRRLLGSVHPHTLAAIAHLAHTLFKQGELPGARVLMAQVLEARRRILSPEHPDTLSAMNNLAASCWKLEDYAAVRALEEELLAIKQRVLGEEDEQALKAMDNLAATLDRLECNDYAAALRAQAHAIRRQVAEREHPETVATLDRMVGCVRQWALLGGESEPQVDYGDGYDSASYGLQVAGRNNDEFDCYVDVSVEPPSLSIYLYPSLTLLEETIAEISPHLESTEGDAGQLELVGDEHRLRYQSSIELPDGILTSDMIDRLIGQGIARLDAVLPELRALK